MNKIQELITKVGLSEKEKGFLYYDDLGGETFLSYNDQYIEATKILSLMQNDYHIEKGSKVNIIRIEG